jgi:TrmH family RNA methyltransferase
MDSKLTSLQNTRVRQAQRLRKKRGRQQQGKIIIDGGREILRAADAGCQITEIFLCPEWSEAAGSELLVSNWLTLVYRLCQ